MKTKEGSRKLLLKQGVFVSTGTPLIQKNSSDPMYKVQNFSWNIFSNEYLVGHYARCLEMQRATIICVVNTGPVSICKTV